MEISYETPKQSKRFATMEMECGHCGAIVAVTKSQVERKLRQPQVFGVHCFDCGFLLKQVNHLNNCLNAPSAKHTPKSVAGWERELDKIHTMLADRSGLIR